MSRRSLEPRETPLGIDGPAAEEVAVGWDSQMATFFAQAFGRDDRALVDRGDVGDRIDNAGEALDAVRPYAAIPPGMEHELMRDALADLETRGAEGQQLLDSARERLDDAVTSGRINESQQDVREDDALHQAADYDGGTGLSMT